MTSKGLSKNMSLFESLNDSDRDVYKATVKITTFSSKEEKWVHHSYEETHINRGRQISSLKSSSTKTASDSAEGLEQIENSIKKALRDSSSDNSQSEEDRQRLREMNEFLMNSTKQIKKMYQDKNSSSLKYLDPNKFFSEQTEKKNIITSSVVNKIEENLKKEIETILIQVYIEHINKTQESDFSAFENQLHIFSESASRKANIQILQLLTEKITIVVEKVKDKIYIINEVRVLKEKFYELKHSHENKAECLEKSRASHCKSKAVELNEKIKKAIREMLIELRENIYSVLESSNNLQRLFDPILQHLVEESEMKFNFEEMHREELSKTVAKDEFLKIIFLQIKSNAKNQNYKELNDILLDIEEVLKITGGKEMTKLKNIISLYFDKVSLNLKNHFFPKECPTNVTKKSDSFCSCNCSHKELVSTIDSSSKLNSANKMFQATPKKEKFKDIDELINYINKGEDDEGTKPKKNKKKHSKKEKKTNKDQVLVFDIEKLDKEIEDFKIYISKNSVKAYTIKKIKPVLTREWLRNLSNEVKSI